ncbi:UDP-N-acetylmuramate dehydrogenase [Parafrigoribacterium soli]|uniref:UDP-N-acetylmuramate dehydrogenase n=1 Tax=Parafrigoribacterium soli TaxID=3144663 RepID=UPI0032EDD860
MSSESVPFSQLTTLRVGGAASELRTPADSRELVDAALEVWSTGDEWLLLGGGSNTVMADEGFDGTAIRVITRGIERVEAQGPHSVRLRVQAGESWDGLVAHAVEHGWSGIEALSGIPGSVGAAPVQNIGAYGQELSSSLVAIDFLDFDSGELHRLPASQLAFGYRTSALKQGRRGVVVSVELELFDGSAGGTDAASALSAPVAYAQLASALGVELGARVPLEDLRSAVLRLRAAKGMLLSADDPDSVSTGSFFTNPIVSAGFASALPADAPRWPLEPDVDEPVIVPLENFVPGDLLARGAASVPDGVAPAAGQQTEQRAVKLSAAWLIEHSGIVRGYSLPGSGAAISTKHTLAIVNRGSATASDVAELGRYIQSRVLSEFGVILQPEPVLVGVPL